MIMVNLFGCSGEKFEKYSSQDPLINITAEYIAGWKHDETRGSYNSYAQVMFFPFKEGQISPRALIAVTVRDQSKLGFTPPTAEAALADLLAKRMQFQEAKVLSQSKMKLLGTEAMVIELSYLTLENLLKMDSKLVLVKEKVIIFKKDDYFYFLRYEAQSKDYNKFSSAFTRMVHSIKIKNSR